MRFVQWAGWIVDQYLLADPLCGCAEKLLFPAQIMGDYGKAAPHPMGTLKSLGFRRVWSFWQIHCGEGKLFFCLAGKDLIYFFFNQLCSCAVCLC